MKVLRIHILAAIAVGFLGSGCIPVLRTQIVRYGVEGKLVDADSRAPIAKQRIQVSIDSREHAEKTNREGEFKIRPERHHYCAWLMGGPFRPAPSATSVQILAGDYAPYNSDVQRGRWDENSPNGCRLRDGYIDLGNIQLRRPPLDSATNAGQVFLDGTNTTSRLPQRSQ